jgi:ABC-type bacteriocin/lantibiotic exporter with double-glycine peptidase domain
MILRAHGIPVTLADCREHLAPGPQGVNALSLTEVASKLGLRAKAYSAKTPEALRELPLPAILHFGLNHFVVLERGSRGGVSIVDPAVGRRKLSWPDLMALHSGLALAFERSSEPPVLAPAPRRWSHPVRQFLGQPGARRLAAGLIAATLFLVLLGLGLPLTAAAWIDAAWTSDPSRQVDILGAGVAALALMLIVLGHLRSLLLVFFGSRAAALMVRSLEGAVRRTVAGHTVSLIADGLWSLILLLILLAIAPWSAAVVLVATGLQAVLLLGRPPERGDSTRIPSWRQPAHVAVQLTAPLLLLWIGTHRILDQRMTPGTLLAITCLAVQCLGAASFGLSAWQRLRFLGLYLHAPGPALEERPAPDGREVGGERTIVE